VRGSKRRELEALFAANRRLFKACVLMERLGHFLFKHIEGIPAFCNHHVRFGVVESINATIKVVLRPARGIKNEEMLLLKLKRATAHPIRSARDLTRFLNVQPLYSNR
jgi:transposase